MQSRTGRDRRRGSFVEPLETRVLMSTYTFSQLASFSNAIGTIPVGPLVEDPEGDILGTCQNGGASGSNGSIFEWHPSTGQLSTLVSFAGTNGLQPTGLTIDANGNLFGEAVGGTSNDGELFEVARGSGTIQVLATFGPGVGVSPTGGLTLDSGGNLFGVTYQGGPSDSSGDAGTGTVFELAKGSNTITTLATFYGAPLENPSSNLILINGALYGTATDAAGFGGVFKESGGTITEVASFDNLSSLSGAGTQPVGNIVLDKQGDLLGESTGSVSLAWELPAGGNAIHPVALLNPATPANSDGVALDPNENLIGTLSSGVGTANVGGVFEVPLGGASASVVHVGSTDGDTGMSPSSPPFIDSNGNVFGVEHAGGDNGAGTLWKLTPMPGGGTTGSGNGGGSTASPSGLAPAVNAKFPSSVLPGQKINISSTTTITDTLSTTVRGNVQVALYLSSESTVDSSSILLASTTKKVNLKPHGHIVVPEKVPTIPSSVPQGTFNVVVQITDPSGKIAAAAATQTITVAPANIKLTASFVKIPSGKSGQKSALTIAVSNSGNIPAATTLPIVVSASTNGMLADAHGVGSESKPVNIKPGKLMKITIPLTLPTTPGSYFLIVQLDPNSTIAKLTDPDAVFVSATKAAVG